MVRIHCCSSWGSTIREVESDIAQVCPGYYYQFSSADEAFYTPLEVVEVDVDVIELCFLQ